MPNLALKWKNVAATDFADNSTLQAAWDRLNALHGDLPFLTADVVISALKIFGDNKERLLVAYQGATIAAMLILCRTDAFRWRTFQPSQLPLGAWVAEANLSLDSLARALLRGPLGLCLGLSVTQVDPHMAARTVDTPDSQTLDYVETGWIDIQGSFDDYWSARGKNLRQNMRKQRAKLAADNVSLTMQVLHDHADMAGAVARYGQMESAGWKAQEGTSIHPDNAQGRFYRELLEHASQRGEAAVYQYLFNDKIVSMNLCLQRKGTLVVLKTTYDESIQSVSPAFLLREEELRQFHAEGKTKRLEYFGRLMEWHTKWTDQKRMLYHLTVYRWPAIKSFAEARRHKAEARLANQSVAGATKNDSKNDLKDDVKTESSQAAAGKPLDPQRQPAHP